MPVALVTGASSGLGRASADHLARAGFRVYGTSRNGTPAASYPSVATGSLPLVAMDVTNEDSVRDVVRLIEARESRLDVVVNNAGMGIAGAAEDTSADEVRRQMETNFEGAARVCRLTLPRLRAQGSGCIVNVSSMAGLISVPYQSFYSASKFALEGFSAGLREEVRPFGVRVVVVRAGDYRTSFTQNRVRVAGWTASSYRESAERALAIMERDEQAGPDPAGVGRLVADIATGKKGGNAYVVGGAAQRLLFGLRHVLPESAIAWALRQVYQIG
jgi:NAD(P)-dependent dehydrogenase (short-subunit alcohol dehydrogenase family)